MSNLLTENKELQYLLAWEHLRRRIAELAIEEEDLVTTYQICAEEVGRFFNVDRCMVINYTPIEPGMREVQGGFSGQYSAPGIRKILDEELLERDYPDFMLEVMKTRLISVSNPTEIRAAVQNMVSSLPCSDGEKEAFFNRITSILIDFYGAQSILRVAILYQGISFGSLVLHQCTPRKWEEREQEALKDIGYHIGNVLYQARLRAKEQIARNKLEKRSIELEQLITIVSHDLSEPLRKILIYSNRLQSLESPDVLGEEQNYIQSIQKFSTYMQTQLSALIEFLKVTRETEGFQPVDLNKLAHRVLRDLESYRQEQNGYIHMDKGALTISGVPNQLYQLLWNLLHNALKFHNQGQSPVVELTIQRVNEQFCEITVKDEGPGFDECYLDRIFLPFERLHNRAEYEGMGMGLAIVNKIVEHHNGTITVHSTPGMGAVFTVLLPMIQA